MIVFLLVAFVMVLVPSVGMIWAPTDTTGENRELAPAPALVDEDGSFNKDVLADAGAYFDDHFALRNQVVAANAHLRAALGSSATDQVVVGSNDWLYYGGTLNDYLGRSALTDRSLANIAHNLQLAQGYVSSKGSRLVFAVAPNKNTLYDQDMPAYFVRCPDPSNFERLLPYLQQSGVSYIDLFGLMRGQDQTLYLKRDTHWDNRGALLAANSLLQAAGKGPLPVSVDSATMRDDFVGDLQGMLYPGELVTEPNYYYAGYNDADEGTALSWQYTEGADVTDSLVRTQRVAGPSAASPAEGGAAGGSLLMFRDSFGNALLPFLAAAFDQATFSKLVPYNLTTLAQSKSDVVVIERAERHLADLATEPPIMPNPVVSFENGLPEGAVRVEASLECSQEGSYWVVRGTVDEPLSPESRLYLCVQPEGGQPVLYDPFWLSFADENGEVWGDHGFMAYIGSSAIDVGAANLSVYVK